MPLARQCLKQVQKVQEAVGSMGGVTEIKEFEWVRVGLSNMVKVEMGGGRS